MMEEKQTDTWSSYLPEMQYIMNTQLNSVTKSTPYKIVFGMQHNLGLDGIIDGGNEEEETSTAPSTSSKRNLKVSVLAKIQYDGDEDDDENEDEEEEVDDDDDDDDEDGSESEDTTRKSSLD